MNSDLTGAEEEKIKIAKRSEQYFLNFVEEHFVAVGSCIDDI